MKLFTIALCAISSFAFSKTIAINSFPQLQLIKNKDKIYLQGTIALFNKGDTKAFEAYPEIQLGEKKFQLDKGNIDPNTQFSWEIKELIQDSAHCEKCPLKNPGLYPFVTTIHYKDSNYYPFSAIQVNHLLYNPQEATDLLTNIQIPSLSMFLKINSHGEKFDGLLQLKNLTQANLAAAINFYYPQEIILKAKNIAQYPIAATRESTIAFHGQNDTGLINSKYVIFAIAEWEENGWHKYATSYDSYTISKNPENKYSFWVYYGVFFAILSVITTIYIITRKSR
ncbi:MAG: hypothetical protein H6621_03870 [Halobacteriovoraceae bacterium]|nr:hypothetical protein [Halobacteriovoraceae bacterium]